MQLHIRGERTTVVESHENETIADLKKKLWK
uniref:Small subunit ribosomal protein S30e n=1 Tax=Apis cerana TaxID=7461 RepID=V9IHW9_APICE